LAAAEVEEKNRFGASSGRKETSVQALSDVQMALGIEATPPICAAEL